jgi:hypothetical protein
MLNVKNIKDKNYIADPIEFVGKIPEREELPIKYSFFQYWRIKLHCWIRDFRHHDEIIETYVVGTPTKKN